MCGRSHAQGDHCDCDDGPVGSKPRETAFFDTLLSKMTSNVGGDVDRQELSAWLKNWLDHPVPALGGVCPVDLLDTEDGRTQVSNMLGRVTSGAYS